MDFRTQVKTDDCRGLIRHGDPIMMIGSCFSDNIGQRLAQALFETTINPFGTLYNPASIANALNDLIVCRTYNENDLIENDGRYHSFSHHSSFSGINATSVIEKINMSIETSSQTLRKSSTLIVTFGTAYVFELASTQKIVSNCHKLPSKHFNRRRMSVSEIVDIWNGIVRKLHDINSQLNIIFTVSPIRHLADGAHDNQLSKSTLLLAIENLCNSNERIGYFPAYEIMMDDLRDYRFYASDMTHPSETAVDYIYEKFSHSYFNDSTMQLAKDCERLTRRLRHRHMSDDEQSIKRFTEATDQIREKLLSTNPCLTQAIENITRL